MIVLTRKQVNLIRVGGILVIALCCCGLLLTLGGGAIAVKQRPEVLARLGLPISGTLAMTRTFESPVATSAFSSPLGKPGAFSSPLGTPGTFISPLPAPTEAPPAPPAPSPQPPAPPATTPPPPAPAPPTEPPPAPASTAKLIAYYVTGDLVNIRDKPDPGAKIVRRAHYGDTIAVYEDSIGQGWYHIAGEGGDEYISAEFASNTVPPTYTPTGPPPAGEETPGATPTGPSPTEKPAGEETPEAKPTEALPTPPPGKGLLIVYNDTIGQEVTFNIANTEYKMNHGVHVEIPLTSGRYGWTMSAPFQDSTSQDIEIRVGETQTLHF